MLFDSVHNVDWDAFSEMMNEKNPSDEWEAEVQNFGWRRIHGVKKRFVAKNGKELLGKILPNADCEVKIFELDNRGFSIQNFHHDNNTGSEWYHILPACEEGFYRDWDRDGICVKNTWNR